MTNPNQLSLEDVLDRLLDEYESPSRHAVAHYSSLYPQYRLQLIEFAAIWAEQKHLADASPLSDEQETRVAQRAQSFIQNALYDSSQRHAEAVIQSAPVSLAKMAKDTGQTTHEVARLAGLDEILMSKLNARRIRVESVPERLKSRLADILQVTVEQIRASLAFYEGYKPGFAFRAMAKPVTPEPEDFASAVMSSTLTDEEKEKLVSVE